MVVRICFYRLSCYSTCYRPYKSQIKNGPPCQIDCVGQRSFFGMSSSKHLQLLHYLLIWFMVNKKHLKNVGPIRHCEQPHAACFTLPFTRCRYCRTPPAHRYPQQQRRRRRRQQRQRVTEGTAMAP